jgi:hypothetical protein
VWFIINQYKNRIIYKLNGGECMKKLLILGIAIAMIVTVLAGCSGTGATKTGLGVVTSIAKSTDASMDDEGTPKAGLAQADVIMAAVSIDSQGRIVSVSIDSAQVRVNFDTNGIITTDINAALKTKTELGDDYGMKARAGAVAEWYEQIEALENWMLGKTLAQVKAMKTYEKDATHKFVPDEADLKTSVTITVEGYIDAVEKAINNAK